MATPEEAETYAERLIDPRMQIPRSDGDPVPQQNIADVAEGFAYLPVSVLEVLAIRDYHIAPVRPTEYITDYEPAVRADLAMQGLTGMAFEIAIASMQGVHQRQDRMIYLADHRPGVLVHEVAHAVDAVYGGSTPEGERFNSNIDRLIVAAYLDGRELLNSYCAVSPLEAFSEWYRASWNVRDPELDSPDVGVREDADARAPRMMQYLDALHEAFEILLERDPRAFDVGASFDRRTEIVARAQISVVLGVPVRDVDMAAVREVLERPRDNERQERSPSQSVAAELAVEVADLTEELDEYEVGL